MITGGWEWGKQEERKKQMLVSKNAYCKDSSGVKFTGSIYLYMGVWVSPNVSWCQKSSWFRGARGLLKLNFAFFIFFSPSCAHTLYNLHIFLIKNNSNEQKRYTCVSAEENVGVNAWECRYVCGRDHRQIPKPCSSEKNPYLAMLSYSCVPIYI